MSPELLGIVAVGVLIAAAVYAFKPKRPPAPPAAPAQPQTVYVQGEQPKFFDLFVQDKREREAEIERQLLRATLDRISGIVGPEPKPPASPSPNP